TSLLPKVPPRALAPKMKSATQSVVLNPMRLFGHHFVMNPKMDDLDPSQGRRLSLIPVPKATIRT
ncbi:MAG: hypothetical protein WAV38_19380, partial [Xanthobacteraceae bacterium]